MANWPKSDQAAAVLSFASSHKGCLVGGPGFEPGASRSEP